MATLGDLDRCVNIFWHLVNFVCAVDRGDDVEARKFAQGLSASKLAWMFQTMPAVDMGKLPRTRKRGRIYNPIGTLRWIIHKCPCIIVRRNRQPFLALRYNNHWQVTLDFVHNNELRSQLEQQWEEEE